MPEVPDLEAIRTFFNHRIVGETVERVDPVIPFIVRVPRDEFVTSMTGDTFGEVHRFGKFRENKTATVRARANTNPSCG